MFWKGHLQRKPWTTFFFNKKIKQIQFVEMLLLFSEINHIIVFYQQIGGQCNNLKLKLKWKGFLASPKDPLFQVGSVRFLWEAQRDYENWGSFGRHARRVDGLTAVGVREVLSLSGYCVGCKGCIQWDPKPLWSPRLQWCLSPKGPIGVHSAGLLLGHWVILVIWLLSKWG